MSMRVRASAVATALVALLTVLSMPSSAAAHPSAYSIVERTYSQTGTVPVCRFSSAELEAALRQAPTYDVEYFGDFIDAINSALTEQAGGQCGSARARGSLRERGLKGVRIEPLPASATTGTYGAIPLPLLLAAILLVAGAVAAALLGVLRLVNRPR